MWLATATDTPWKGLAEAIGRGLPVPEGFVVSSAVPEDEVRAAYEDLKIRTRIHFVAVRGPSHSVLNVIGPDQVIHTLRRFWAESPRAAVLIQRMVPAVWCGKAEKDGTVIRANEGLAFLDPDTYAFENGAYVRRSIELKQRKMLRYVDGTTRTIERDGERSQLTEAQLKKIADLAIKAEAGISWALDDQNREWLLAVDAG
jgi:hypothetical protein